MGRRRRTSFLSLILTLAAIPCAAHPPYEDVEQVITLSDGRRLSLVRSFVDGIFFTDPVKLVVRDDEERTVAVTEYGRDLAILCTGDARCVIYRYDGLIPVLPENVWRFENGVLSVEGSAFLLLLGAMAPMWEHPGGYLFAVVSLGLPLLVWRVDWKGRSAKGCLVGAAALATFPYAAVWLYVVVVLSRLSLPLVIVSGMLVVGTLVLARGVSVRLGASELAIRKVVNAALVVVAVLAIAGIAWVVVAAGRVTSYSRGITFEEPQVRPPLVSARLTRVHGTTSEMFVELASGVTIDEVVDLTLFGGFAGGIRRDEAEARLGPPSGRWTDPVYRIEAPYYQRAAGRVSLVRRADSWTTVGHPSACTHETFIRDTALRDQIRSWLPAESTIQVNFRETGGGNLVSAGLSRDACTHLVLTR